MAKEFDKMAGSSDINPNIDGQSGVVVGGNAEAVAALLLFGANVEALNNDGVTPLQLAAKAGLYSVVKVLVENGASVNMKTDVGSCVHTYGAVNSGYLGVQPMLRVHSRLTIRHSATGPIIERVVGNFDMCRIKFRSPLHLAAKGGHLTVVEFLLDRGAEVNSEDSHGRTPLDLAAELGHFLVVELLLRKGADVNFKGSRGCFQAMHSHRITFFFQRDGNEVCMEYNATPLHFAAKAGHHSIVGLLVKKGGNVDIEDNYGFTPLNLAVETGHLDIASYLIKNGAEVNTECWKGRTPLHRAAQAGYLSIVRLLIENGAEVNFKGKRGAKCIYPSTYDSVGSDQLFVKTKYNASPLHLAIIAGYLSVVRLLVHSGAELNSEDIDGYNPLYLSVRSGKLPIVKCLVDNGADFKTQPWHRKSLLNLAVEGGYLSIVRYFIQIGLDVNTMGRRVDTPVHRSVTVSRSVTKPILVERHPEEDIQNECKCTPLHIGAETGNSPIVEYLLKEGADVNMKDVYGSTPLHRAARNGHLHIVHLLLDAGADVNSKDIEVYTPLYYAAMGDHLAVVQFLVDRGAKLHLQ